MPKKPELGVYEALPIDVDGALEFAREREALGIFGEVRRDGVAPSGVPKELGRAYARVTSAHVGTPFACAHR